MPDVTSKHLRTSTELTVIAPIKHGFIENVDTMTYASRLRLLLNVLFELRKAADERKPSERKPSPTTGARAGREYVGPLERLQTLHFVQWALIDGDTKLMLNVTFDRSWEAYIRDIVDLAGPLLDVILCHCADYEGHDTSLGYEKFAEWVRAHQVENDFFFAAEPGLTADDHRLHKKLAALPAKIVEARADQARADQARVDQALAQPIGAELEAAVAALRVTVAMQTDGTIQDMQRIASALFDLRRYFAASSTPHHASYLSASARQDLVFFDEVAYELLSGFGSLLREPAGSTPGEKLLAAWYNTLPDRRRTQPHLAAIPGARVPLEALHDIQRGLLTPYPDATHGCLALVQWPDRAAGAKLLAALRDRITVEGRRDDEAPSLSLALTFRGLARLDLSEDELRAFPKELQEGMEARSGILGDIEDNHPSEWQLPRDENGEPVALGSVDAVILLQGNAPSAPGAYRYDFEWSKDHPLREHLLTLIEGTGAQLVHVQALRREYRGKAMIEHFGYRDDVSQPHVPFEQPQGSAPRAVLARDAIAPGEVVLGYPNARGEVVRYAVRGVHDPERDLLKNGSFLVLRKLEQHVRAFESYMATSAAQLGIAADELKAQLMGRRPGEDAAPLAAERRDPNDDHARPEIAELSALNSFDFSEPGNGCPFHAHIRRVNPRDADQARTDRNTSLRAIPRILRRSFTYGPPFGTAKPDKHDEHERGLLFMAFNAGIADQYEVLQRWVSGGNSTGIGSSLADLIAGGAKGAAFPVRTPAGVRWLAPPREPLVSLRWGLYTFVPSLSAIDRLIERAGAARAGSFAADEQKKQLALRGLGIIAKLQTLPEALARVEWKRLLENRDALADTRAIWAGVLQRGGALRTPYGVLVAGKHHVYAVLKDAATYSVREYWHRMDDSIGRLHLGMDPEPARMPAARATARDLRYEAEVQPGEYARHAEPLNRAMHALKLDHGFKSALELTGDALSRLPSDPSRGTVACDLRELSVMVLQSLSGTWFGTPTPPAALEALPRDKVASLADYRQCSAYVFTPSPEPWVAAGAREAAATIDAALAHDGYRAVKAAQAQLPEDARFPAANDAQLAEGLKGAAFGFLAATLGSLLSALMQWVDSGELWRLQRALATLRKSVAAGTLDSTARQADRARLERALLAAMQRGPVPPVLHRTAVRPAQLGPVSVVPGDRVVVALGTVTAEDPSDVHVMFGGRYEDRDKPVHACPGRELAIGVMTGFAWALLEQQDIRRLSELSPLKLTFRANASAGASTGATPSTSATSS